MKDCLDEALVKDFPYLFADRNGDLRQTCFAFGFECGDGWEPLLREAAEKLEPLCKAYAEQMPAEEKERGGHPRVSQIKEKYGTLRFYMTSATDEMYEIITEAERKSESTCDVCGNPGKLRGHGWLSTTCDEHTKDQDK